MKEIDWQLLWYLFIWWASPFLAVLSFYGKLCRWETLISNTCQNFFAIFSYSLLESSWFNLWVYFRIFCQTFILEKPSLNQNDKVLCENCGTPFTRINLASHRKRCSAGLLYCSKCPNFSTKSQSDLNYHVAKKHSISKHAVTFECEQFYQEFLGNYVLRQHKNTQHGFSWKTADVDPDDNINEVDDANLKEELRSCQKLLVDSEPDRRRHKVCNDATENLNAKIVTKETDLFFNILNCAATVNLDFGFVLRNIKDGGFR